MITVMIERSIWESAMSRMSLNYGAAVTWNELRQELRLMDNFYHFKTRVASLMEYSLPKWVCLLACFLGDPCSTHVHILCFWNCHGCSMCWLCLTNLHFHLILLRSHRTPLTTVFNLTPSTPSSLVHIPDFCFHRLDRGDPHKSRGVGIYVRDDCQIDTISLKDLTVMSKSTEALWLIIKPLIRNQWS